jgi:hypothetical protein
MWNECDVRRGERGTDPMNTFCFFMPSPHEIPQKPPAIDEPLLLTFHLNYTEVSRVW